MEFTIGFIIALAFSSRVKDPASEGRRYSCPTIAVLPCTLRCDPSCILIACTQDDRFAFNGKRSSREPVENASNRIAAWRRKSKYYLSRSASAI
jgi:hypothetical protein